MSEMEFKYVRIEGKGLVKNTLRAMGVFGMCWELVRSETMTEEDADLYREIDAWFAEELPWPPPCKRQEPVICWFKTENSREMLTMIRPALWLLDRYHCPYFLVYTNTPGEIVYEDQYQVAVKADEFLNFLDVPKSWSPE